MPLRDAEAPRRQRLHRDERYRGAPADLRRAEKILRSDVDISALVNNAGIGATPPLVASDVDAMEDMIHLNVTALTRLTYAAAPTFLGHGTGTIISVSSAVAIALRF